MRYLLVTILLLFIGCNPNQGLTPLSYNVANSKTEAILKLDTKGHTALIRDIIVTKSKDIISASDDKTIRVWDSVTGVEKRKILGEIGAGSGEIFAMALSPNEEFLAIGGMLADNPKDGSVIRIYNYQSGRLIKVLKSHTNVVLDLFFSSDGKYLISGSGDKTAKIWNIERDFRLVDTISFHTNYVYAVNIIKSRSDYFAVTAGYDNKIALYNMQTKEIVNSHQLGYKLEYLATSKENIAVCGFNENKIQIYNFNLNPIKTIVLETKPNGLAYSPNEKLLIAGTYTSPRNVNIYSVNQNYKKIQSFKEHKNLTMAVAFLDNQTAISGGGNNSEIYIWNIKIAEVLKKIVGVGKRVWSVGVKGEIIAWGNHSNPKSNNNRGELQKSINLKTFQIFGHGVNSMFHRVSTTYKNYQLLHRRGGGYNFANGVLDIKRDGKVDASIIRDSTNGLRHNCYGFYKNYIVSGGSSGQLKIYNLKGKEVANLVGHTGEVWSIAIDGDRLVSGSGDKTIKIWDLSKLKRIMQPQLSLFISKGDDWIAWTPQGFYDASKGAEKYIGYHINHGSEHEAEFLNIGRFRKQYYRPDLIQKALKGEDLTKYAKNIDIDALLKAGLAPKVKILTDSSTIDHGSTEIGVSLCDIGGGFDNLNFYVDGKAIKYLSKTKAFAQKKKQVKNCTIIEQSISVPSGKHTVSFDATNKEGNIISNTPTITVTNTQKEVIRPNLHILTLSIKDYKDDSLDLEFPNNDADELSQKLKTIGKPVFGHVYSYALKDSQVTKEEINKKVAQIAPKVGANDVFVLYISGHGITNDADGDYYFIPYGCANGSDVTKNAINQDEFKKIMSQIKAVKSVILLDTCESGSMASKDLIDTSVKRFGGNVGSAIIAGATSRQNAIDGYKKHGIFTYTVLDAMDRKDLYYRNIITVPDIVKHLKWRLPELAKEKFGHEQNAVSYMNGDISFAIGGL